MTVMESYRRMRPTVQYANPQAQRIWARLLCVFVPVLAVVSGMPRATAAEHAIRFKLVDGKLCARCALHSPAVAIPANVVIDLGASVPLLIHERTARLLKIGHGTLLEVRFGDLVLSDLRGRPLGLLALDKLTRDHSADLGEVPAVAILGLPALADFTVQLAVDEGVIHLLPPAEGKRQEAEGKRPGDESSPEVSGANGEACTLPFEEEGPSYWLHAAGPDGFALRTRFATSDYDTFIDSTVTDLLGAPGGELDRVDLGCVNVARYVALRPRDLSTTPEPHPDLVLGTNLLAHFRVTIDQVNHRMTFEQTRPPSFPVEERAYFIAEMDEDADAVEAFLSRHGSSRLAAEAASTLLALRLDDYPPSQEALVRAMRLRAAAVPQERRSGEMLRLSDELTDSDRDDKYALAGVALEIGLEHAPQALNGTEAHRIHARLGLVALRRDDLRQARRHLLSAAFGLPRDPLVNLWLGELYERMGKLTRAWSRYVQAAISKDRPPAALEGLDRLNRNPAFRADFSMSDAQQLLEGRVVEFHPAGRHPSATGGDVGQPARLVELFTCVDEPATLGAELAFGALREYFDRSAVALIEYHLSSPEADPLTCEVGAARRAFYGVEHVPVAYFDGGAPLWAGGDDGEAERIFSGYVSALSESPQVAAQWRLSGTASFRDTAISGRVELDGPQGGAGLRLHVILCEKAVMLPGANSLLLHRQVARSAVAPPRGFVVPSAVGRRVFDIRVDTTEVRADLERAIATIEKEGGIEFTMRPTYVDAGSSVFVAFLQEESSRRVWAACEFDVAPAKGAADADSG